MSDGAKGRGPGSGPEHFEERDLDDLRRRLDALQATVELLGTEGSHPPTPPPPPQPPIVTYPEPAYEALAETYEPTIPTDNGAPPPLLPGYGYEPGYAQEPRPWPEDPYYLGLGPAPHAAYGPPAPLAYAPPPGPDPGYAPAASLWAGAVEFLDVGPFSSLVELREFEDAIGAIESVRALRVRRFGHRRAEIDVWTVGPNPLSSELWRLGRPLSFKPGFEGQLIIEFAKRNGGRRSAGTA